jgi:LDH2 family malate/lactate/ureidoglycolate dehydrogenase
MVETETRQRFDAEGLRQFTAAAFAHFGVDAKEAAVGAEVLLDADLMGIESHGIAHLNAHPGYIPGLKRGIVNPRPAVKVLRETETTAAWEGDAGLGIVIGKHAMEACLAKAATSGIGMVTVTNGRHFGAAGYYAHMAARRDMIGMAMCNVPPIAVAAGGLDRVFGTNPIAMAAPVQEDNPFLLDMATTAVAGGKLEIAARQGKSIPAGWAVDKDGNDATDPHALRQGGGLLPLGSHMITSSYKGYGLGIMVDILTGVLSTLGSGLFASREVLEQAYWFAAWRIDAFRDPAEFKGDMKKMVDGLRSSRPAPGIDAVRVAGDPEWAKRADRTKNGIPLDPVTIEQLTALGEEIGVPFPSPVG